MHTIAKQLGRKKKKKKKKKRGVPKAQIWGCQWGTHMGKWYVWLIPA
jgi:hypothetical protein